MSGTDDYRTFSDLEVVPDGGTEQYECDTCGVAFDTPQGLAGHQQADHEKPWTDAEVLERLYVDQGLTTHEMGEILGCSQVTVSNWLGKYDIDTRQATRRPGEYADEDLLRDLYLQQELSIEAIADEFGCSHTTIDYWLEKFDIPKRDKHEKMVERLYRIPPMFSTDLNGYERWQGSTRDGDWTVLVHRLLVVAEEGLEAVKGKDVHHKNGIPWDNRPGNLEALSRSEHIEEHQQSDYPWRRKYE